MHQHSHSFILIGPPGAGKSTFAQILHDKYNYHIIHVGRLLRQHKPDLVSGTSGKLVHSGYVHDLLRIHLPSTTSASKKKLVFDGFPKTQEQAKWLVRLLTNEYKHPAAVVFLAAHPEVGTSRLTSKLSVTTQNRHDLVRSLRDRSRIYIDHGPAVIEHLRRCYQPSKSFYKIDANSRLEIARSIFLRVCTYEFERIGSIS